MGHCSLQIGENNSPENYVSWWPDGTAKFSGRNNVLTSFVLHNDEIKQAPYVLIPKEYDIQAENEQPHVTYHLHPDCFDLVKIQAAWQRIKTKSNPHYRMIGKNCADIVGRILTEGASAPLPTLCRKKFKAWIIYDTKRYCRYAQSTGKRGKRGESCIAITPKEKS